MKASTEVADAVVIGGGFYGICIAIYLAKERDLKRVILIEKESTLMQRASHTNQARVHNGCHYPRSFTTAFRSRVNLPRFIRDWEFAVKRDFHNLYAIAKKNSKVTTKQFERFCKEIGASIKPAKSEHYKLFEPKLIDSVFLVQEYAFDAQKIANWAAEETNNSGIEVRYSTRVGEILPPDNTRTITISTDSNVDGPSTLKCKYVFNCTYSGLNHLKGGFTECQVKLKHELTEMALLELPDEMKEVGITIMDGPFFSIMPFPSRNLHTLSHVRYTPHFSWQDNPKNDPYLVLESNSKESRVDRMLRDAARYLPSISAAKYVESLFEIKTVLAKNEGDDGRPILFHKHGEIPGLYSILGGKIDNIYDVIEKLNNEDIKAFK